MTEKTIPSIVVLVGGLVALFFSFQELYYSQISSTWPTTIAKVESLEKKIRTGNSGRSKFSKNKINLGSSEYSLIMTYSYDVNEFKHESNRINFKVFNALSQNEINELIDKYSSKENISIFYNPNDPTQATVEVGLSYKNFILLAIACFFLALFYLINKK